MTHVFKCAIMMLAFLIEAWLSLVERCVRDAEAAGSNPVASTNREDSRKRCKDVFGIFFLARERLMRLHDAR